MAKRGFCFVFLLSVACATTASQTDSTPFTPDDRQRPFNPSIGDTPLLAGISYGPFREGQSPSGPYPTSEQILEDLNLVAQRWNLIRIYGSRTPADTILQVIRDHDLPIRVMLGVWIDPKPEYDNDAEVEAGIRLANEFSERVVAVNVGNESQVSWSNHRVPRELLLKHLRRVRQSVAQPVTTADDYNFWNKPESQSVAKEVDFLVVHAYAMWNGKTLDESVAWTASTVEEIRELHPGKQIVIGETGWATELNPEGSEIQHIKAPAGEAEQKRFFTEFSSWAKQARVPYFYFEAFDEPWKGSDDPREVEKHWGLYRVDRTPKPALQTSDN